MANELTVRADRAGAVNTLMMNAEHNLLGDNTDGHGLVTDLRKNLGLTITNERILILGAGGATRGVLDPLLELGPTELVIANRSPDRAVNLASLFVDLGAIRGCGFEDVGDEPFDIVINATAAGLIGRRAERGRGDHCEPHGLLRHELQQGVDALRELVH